MHVPFDQYAKEIAKLTGISRITVGYIFRAALTILIKHLRDDDSVRVFPYGMTFKTIYRKAREVVDLNNGGYMQLPPTKQVKMTLSYRFKRAVRENELDVGEYGFSKFGEEEFLDDDEDDEI